MSDPDFDWTDVDVVIPVQSPIAVYANPEGDIVVRQDGDWFRREDHWIVATPENARRLAHAILRRAGELDAGKAADRAAEPPRFEFDHRGVCVPVEPEEVTPALPQPQQSARTDRTAAERARRYREKKRSDRHASVTANVTEQRDADRDAFLLDFDTTGVRASD